MPLYTTQNQNQDRTNDAMFQTKKGTGKQDKKTEKEQAWDGIGSKA